MTGFMLDDLHAQTPVQNDAAMQALVPHSMYRLVWLPLGGSVQHSVKALVL